MATLSIPESPLTHVSGPPLVGASVGDVPSTLVTEQDSSSYISVKCGSASGDLYLEKLRGSTQWGGIKCIFYDSSWVTPIEFESHGGKTKSKNWRRSIYHNNTQLGVFLSSCSFLNTSRSSPSISRSPSPNPGNLFDGKLIDPVLAFIKAYRLKGDKLGLKQAVLSAFDPTILARAHKNLWDFCKDNLVHLGLSYHARRSSEKRVVADVLIADILVAFEKLDADDRLPVIFCEANDLICLPTLAPDPVSQRLDLNSTILESLVKKVQEFSSAPSQVALSNQCSSLDTTISNLKGQLEQLSTSVTSLLHSCTKSSTLSSATAASQAAGPSNVHVNSVSTAHPRSRDRSNNIILFGLPESSLLKTKTAIDDMTAHLIGRSVKVADAFRLGKRPDVTSLSDVRPRPILIKLENCWDKRLLLSSCRKLKDYPVNKLFIREDLPPEARQRKPPRSTSDNSSTPALKSTSASPGNASSDSVSTDKITVSENTTTS